MNLLRSLLVVSLLAVPTLAHAELRVVATIPDLAAVAREIGGKDVSVVALALQSQDPHFVDARPSLALELNKADMLLVAGLDLEVGWLPTLLTGARNGKIQKGSPGYVDCSRFVKLLDVPQQKVERSMGDIHPGGNPHYMYDPRRGEEVAKGIAGKLKELDPAHAEAFGKNLDAFLKKAEESRAKLEPRLAAFKGAKILGYHKSLTYLCDWLGLDTVGFLEPKPGIPPNPTHVAMVLSLAKRDGVKVIVQEEYYPDTASSLVAEKAGAKLVKLPGGTDFRGGEGYLAHVEEVVGLLEQGFGGAK